MQPRSKEHHEAAVLSELCTQLLHHKSTTGTTKIQQLRMRSSPYEAAKSNERLSSREGAAEEIGIDRTRLARIELGSTIPYQEEVLLMADCYKAPELKGNYCREMCPLGKNMPKIENAGLDRISLRMLSSFKKINEAKESLLDITADGIISEEEKPELKKIIQTLDEVNEITQNLKNWIERNLE